MPVLDKKLFDIHKKTPFLTNTWDYNNQLLRIISHSFCQYNSISEMLIFYSGKVWNHVCKYNLFIK